MKTRAFPPARPPLTDPCLFQAAKFIEYDTSFSEEEKKQSKVLKVSCNLNNAACKLKLRDYKQAEKLCTKVTRVSYLVWDQSTPELT